MAIAWSEVVAKPEYKSLSDADKKAARDEYFDYVVMPQLKPHDVDDAYLEFTSYDRSLTPSAPPPAVPTTRTWGEAATDTAKIAKSGIHGVAGAIGAGIEFATEKRPDNEYSKDAISLPQAANFGRDLRISQQEAADEVNKSMSQRGQELDKKALFDGFIPQDFGVDWIESAAQKSLRSLPGMVATIPVGGVLTKGISKAVEALPGTSAAIAAGAASPIGAQSLRGAIASQGATQAITDRALAAAPSAIGYGTAEGGQAALQNSSQIRTEIEGIPFDVLKEKSPLFVEYAAIGGDEAARNRLAREAAEDVAVRTAVSTSGLGILTGGGILGALARKKPQLSGGIIARIAKGAYQGGKAEAPQELTQSTAEAYITNLAKQKFIDQGIDPLKGTLSQGMEGMAVGLGTGGATGAVSGAFSGKTPPTTIEESPLTPSAPGGLVIDQPPDITVDPYPDAQPGSLSSAANIAAKQGLTQPEGDLSSIIQESALTPAATGGQVIQPPADVTVTPLTNEIAEAEAKYEQFKSEAAQNPTSLSLALEKAALETLTKLKAEQSTVQPPVVTAVSAGEQAAPPIGGNNVSTNNLSMGDRTPPTESTASPVDNQQGSSGDAVLRYDGNGNIPGTPAVTGTPATGMEEGVAGTGSAALSEPSKNPDKRSGALVAEKSQAPTTSELGDGVLANAQAAAAPAVLQEPKGVTPLASDGQSSPITNDRDAALERRTASQRRAENIATMSAEDLRKNVIEQDRRIRTDNLTGIRNRVAYDEVIADHAANNEQPPLHMFMDINNQKQINEKFGYQGGDAAIKALAQAVQQVNSESFRLGGDEFIGLVKSQEEADTNAAKIKEIMDNAVLEYTAPDGQIYTQKGIGFTYGTGQDIKSADESGKKAKAASIAKGRSFTREQADAMAQDVTSGRKAENKTAEITPKITRNSAGKLAFTGYTKQQIQDAVDNIHAKAVAKATKKTKGKSPNEIKAALAQAEFNPRIVEAGQGGQIIVEARRGNNFIPFAKTHENALRAELAVASSPKPKRKVALPNKMSMLQFVASIGGFNRASVAAEFGRLDDMKAHKSGIFGTPAFRINGGRSWDDIGEALAEAGYLPKNEHGQYDKADLEERLGAELSGNKQYKDGDIENAAIEAQSDREYTDMVARAEELGVDWKKHKTADDLFIAITEAEDVLNDAEAAALSEVMADDDFDTDFDNIVPMSAAQTEEWLGGIGNAEENQTNVNEAPIGEQGAGNQRGREDRGTQGEAEQPSGDEQFALTGQTEEQLRQPKARQVNQELTAPTNITDVDSGIIQVSELKKYDADSSSILHVKIKTESGKTQSVPALQTMTNLNNSIIAMRKLKVCLNAR